MTSVHGQDRFIVLTVSDREVHNEGDKDLITLNPRSISWLQMVDGENDKGQTSEVFIQIGQLSGETIRLGPMARINARSTYQKLNSALDGKTTAVSFPAGTTATVERAV